MKKNILRITLVGAIALASVSANSINKNNADLELNIEAKYKTETFKVYGNCGMCKRTIEGSLDGLKGVKSAEWNNETKLMEVSFNEKKISLDDIKKKIAAVGYDTEEHRAEEKVYSNLHGCCQYDRPEEK